MGGVCGNVTAKMSLTFKQSNNLSSYPGSINRENANVSIYLSAPRCGTKATVTGRLGCKSMHELEREGGKQANIPSSLFFFPSEQLCKRAYSLADHESYNHLCCFAIFMKTACV